MRLKSSTSLFGIATTLPLLILATMVVAGEDPPAKKPVTGNSKPTIEFVDKMIIGNGMDSKASASYTVTIKLQGTEEELKVKFNVGGRFATADASILALEAQLGGGGFPRQPPSQWKYNRDDKKLIIEGWTDPKTKKFHSVESIKFESSDIPKEYWPTIKMPPSA